MSAENLNRPSGIYRDPFRNCDDFKASRHPGIQANITSADDFVETTIAKGEHDKSRPFECQLGCVHNRDTRARYSKKEHAKAHVRSVIIQSSFSSSS